MSRCSWGRSGRVVGTASSLLLVLFAACSDDVTVGDEITPDAGQPDAPPTVDADQVEVDAGKRGDASPDGDAGDEPRCGLDGFCLVESPSSTSPAGQPVNLNDVWLDPDGKAWAVGYRVGGAPLIAVFDGTKWKEAWTGPASLSSIWGLGREEIWAAGTSHVVHGVFRNGAFEWTILPLPPSSYVSKIWAGKPNEAWVVGYSGIQRWTGTEWVMSLPRGTDWAQYWEFGTIWGTETGEAWATVSHAVYDYSEEYNVPTWYIAYRPAGGAPDASDGGDGNPDPLIAESQDGWRTVAGTRLGVQDGSYALGTYSGGVHQVTGRIGYSAGPALTRSRLEGGRVVFEPMAPALDSAGTPIVSAVGFYDLWAGPNEVWALGQFGIYHYDGTSWSFAKTAIDGMPLIALGRPTGIFADSKHVFVVGNNIALRREQQVKP